MVAFRKENAATQGLQLGLKFRESFGKAVYIDQIIPGTQAAALEAKGQISKGDEITMVSATFGDEMWSAKNVGKYRLEKSIAVRQGMFIKFVVESSNDNSKAKAKVSCGARACVGEGAVWVRRGGGYGSRVPVTLWMRVTSEPLLRRVQARALAAEKEQKKISRLQAEVRPPASRRHGKPLPPSSSRCTALTRRPCAGAAAKGCGQLQGQEGRRALRALLSRQPGE